MDNDVELEGFGSTAIHAGHLKESNQAHLVPIYASSTFVFDDAEQGMRRFSGKEEGYIYSRWGNPTAAEAERKIAAMESFGIRDENGNTLQLKAFMHASGMAAITTLLLATLKPGDKVVTSSYETYGSMQELVLKK